MSLRHFMLVVNKGIKLPHPSIIISLILMTKLSPVIRERALYYGIFSSILCFTLAFMHVHAWQHRHYPNKKINIIALGHWNWCWTAISDSLHQNGRQQSKQLVRSIEWPGNVGLCRIYNFMPVSYDETFYI